MDAQLPSRWRWAWFCPRCGVHNPAAAAACEGCGLDHALIGAPGPVVRHSCGVAAPAWAAYCIGCGEALNAPAAEAAGTEPEDGNSPGGPTRSRAGDKQAIDPADELADRDAVFVHDVSEPQTPRDLDAPPLPPPRQRRILPASDGPAEGLTLSRHLLLERAVEPRPHWSERFRLLLVVLIVALSTGLVVRALAAPDDGTINFLRAHAVPGRGSAEALAL